MGFGVWGLGFGVWGLGFGVWGLGFGVWGLGFGGLGFGVWGLGFPKIRGRFGFDRFWGLLGFQGVSGASYRVFSSVVWGLEVFQGFSAWGFTSAYEALCGFHIGFRCLGLRTSVAWIMV